MTKQEFESLVNRLNAAVRGIGRRSDGAELGLIAQFELWVFRQRLAEPGLPNDAADALLTEVVVKLEDLATHAATPPAASAGPPAANP